MKIAKKDFFFFFFSPFDAIFKSNGASKSLKRSVKNELDSCLYPATKVFGSRAVKIGEGRLVMKTLVLHENVKFSSGQSLL